MQVLISVLIGKLFALMVGAYYFRYLPLPYKLVLLNIALAMLVESYGAYLALHLHQHNSWLFNIYTLVDAWLMCIVAVNLIDNIIAKRLFIGLTVLINIIWMVEIKTISINNFATITMVAELILLTVIYFFVLFNNSIFARKSVLKQPVFWVSVSMILYCAPNIPYWGLHNYLISSAPKLSLQLSSINTVLDVARSPLAAISFILLGQQKKAVLNPA